MNQEYNICNQHVLTGRKENSPAKISKHQGQGERSVTYTGAGREVITFSCTKQILASSRNKPKHLNGILAIPILAYTNTVIMRLKGSGRCKMHLHPY